jgi:NAD/NADP transhydrogenase alpha subunit
LLNFTAILFDDESGELNIDWEDEIITNTALTKEGAFIHKEFI